MVSPAKVRANRRNAKKSTGPRTEQGKTNSSRNAIRHGVFCRDVLLDGENDELLGVMRQQFIDSLAPRDFLELSLVERIVADQWRLNRLEEAEKIEYGTRRMQHQNKLEDFLEGKLCGDERVNQWWERFDDMEPEKARKGPAFVSVCSAMGSAAMTMNALMGDDENMLERYQKLRNQLHNSISRALRELRNLRPKDAPPPGPSPFSDQHNAILRKLAEKMELDLPGEEEELEEDQSKEQVEESVSQNEATASEAPATPASADGCAQVPPQEPTASVLGETAFQVQLDQMEQSREGLDGR